MSRPAPTGPETDRARRSGTVATLAELADRLGVSVRSVQRWRESGEMPVARGGRFHVETVRAWRSETTSRNRERSGAAAQGSLLEPDAEAGRRGQRDELRQARVDMLRVQCRERELSIRLRRASLVPREEVRSLLAARFEFFRAKLLASLPELAARVAREAEPVRVQQALEDALLRVLELAQEQLPRGRDSQSTLN